jgi:hypothetical protein
MSTEEQLPEFVDEIDAGELVVPQINVETSATS